MFKVAILTISDKGSVGQRVDETGPSIENLIKDNEYTVEYYKIIPDEIETISKELKYISDELNLDVVFTNGGTGFSKRDVTPEATKMVIDREIPGFAEAMRAKSLEITPKAMLSRAVSGIRNNTIIINLPGSPKAAIENLQIILEPLSHGIEILKGSASECARK